MGNCQKPELHVRNAQYHVANASGKTIIVLVSQKKQDVDVALKLIAGMNPSVELEIKTSKSDGKEIQAVKIGAGNYLRVQKDDRKVSNFFLLKNVYISVLINEGQEWLCNNFLVDEDRSLIVTPEDIVYAKYGSIWIAENGKNYQIG